MKIGTSRKVPKAKCVNCNYACDAAASVGTEDESPSPSPGDVTICINCGHLMIWNENLQFRELTNEEMTEIAGDPRIIAIQKVRAKINEKNPT